ncbi:hypothetical protein XAC3218_20038 [Xanthomonas citri pv. citri]|nr:hypothetical protein XAC3608_20037 [Xanthomonas citri pv. citri]CEE81406.1 hypothetical protein XAC3218_20038 [Xanthomonas citri pv. citri]CEH86426.1 hypothetical protein XACB302_150001 [Xanthomonas citri pv. citri]CEI13953.1 hypothetical protein XACG115_40031 [Xanthomonas citri pv. citri]
MSDFAGVWRLDGAPVAPGDIQRLGQALDARGIGPVRVWQDGPVAIVHRQHVFTPQDADEAMPWVGASGAVLAADVRLAARQELASALQHPANVTLPTSPCPMVCCCWRPCSAGIPRRCRACTGVMHWRCIGRTGIASCWPAIRLACVRCSCIADRT